MFRHQNSRLFFNVTECLLFLMLTLEYVMKRIASDACIAGDAYPFNASGIAHLRGYAILSEVLPSFVSSLSIYQV